ncbi:septation ring formation regulator EzrA [Jeotgalibacillus soli]|uniref:Septation ring formation regulator EzrA n=1 Tax=Jeotgalibacillus soli TaxID=889306 RepID=A0A0C2VIN2_9BACL|nr:septation ring formation regulator EzrA [Jeotgalibacillus soli]KIL43863.1 hypothetical protein KP78_36870 [Jeotgalibacillus soli]
MEYIIGSVILIIIIVAIAFYWRKKHYKEIDRLETLKLEIQHRPILEEMTKVKQLNMNGQTEELFERWRQAWTGIVDVKLPQVDSLLFDAEEYIDKLRFRKSIEIQATIKVMLKQAEEEMNKILVELEELMGSDEKNRSEMEVIQGQYKEAKQTLFAQRHTYGKAAEGIDLKIEALAPKLMQYEEMTKQGDYLEARELVMKLSNEIEHITTLLDTVPETYNEAYYSLPAQLMEVKEGFEEMNQSGYPLTHIKMEEEMELLHESIELARTHTNHLEMDEAEGQVKLIHEHLDVLYDLLETEVEARTHLKEHYEHTDVWLDEVQEQNINLQIETEFVRQSYQLDQEDLNIPKELDNKLNQAAKKYSALKERIAANDVAFSTLWEDLRAIRDELDAIVPAQQAFKEQLQRLRQEEVEVQESGLALKQTLKDQKRMLRHANLPVIPDYIKAQTEEAQDQLEQLEQSLREKPLNIVTIQQHADSADAMVQLVYNDTENMIQTARSVERVIQYGNRYRSKHETVYIGLNEAELLFRKGHYQKALEEAAEAIESVEPGALKKIEELSQERSTENQYA